jgi:hypothetical protein
MIDTVAEERMTAIEQKLDFIVEELGYLRRLRLNAEDLTADLSLVAKDAMRDAVDALGSESLRPVQMIHLANAVLLKASMLEAALHQLESAADFLADAQPLVRDLMRQVTAASLELEKKGYYRVAKAGMLIGDALVQAHSAGDLKQAEDSVPQLVGFLRELTRPEVLQALEAIIHGFGRVQATMNVNKSLLAIVRDLNSPDVRRGIAMLVEFLKVVGASGAAVSSTKSTDSLSGNQS